MKRAISAALALAALTTAFTLLPVLPVASAWGPPETRVATVAVAPGAVRAASAGPAGASLPFPASHLALTWTGDEDARLEVRWAAAGAAPTAWEPAVVDHDMSDGSGAVYSALVVTGTAATTAEVRVVAGSPGAVEVVAIDTVHGPRRQLRVPGSVATAAVDPGAKVGQPSIVTRAQWGADESLRTGTPDFAPIRKLVVHHTATGSHHDPDPAATIRGIYTYHTRVRGWSDIAYNFLVDAEGRVYEGRFARPYQPGEAPTGEDTQGNGVIGAHTFGSNTGSMGVAVLGDLSTVVPSGPSLDAVARLLAWKADRHDIDPFASEPYTSGNTTRTFPNISGHRDAALPDHGTSCPGEELWRRLPGIRQRVAAIVAAAHGRTPGYWTLGRDGSVYAFGQAAVLPGVAGATPPNPAASIAPTPSGRGYWVLGAGGRISAFGDAVFVGSTEVMRLNAPVVRLEPTPSGLGYWVLAADGGIFAFGDARFFGSTGNMRLNAPVVGMARTGSGQGYWLLGRDGGVFSFGDAVFSGSTGNLRLNAPVVSITRNPKGLGYWLVASDGGVFSFGVPFFGSIPGLSLPFFPNSVQIRATGSANGYYVLGADGGVFTFGDAKFHGAQAGLSGGRAATDMALMPDEA